MLSSWQLILAVPAPKKTEHPCRPEHVHECSRQKVARTHLSISWWRNKGKAEVRTKGEVKKKKNGILRLALMKMRLEKRIQWKKSDAKCHMVHGVMTWNAQCRQIYRAGDRPTVLAWRRSGRSGNWLAVAVGLHLDDSSVCDEISGNRRILCLVNYSAHPEPLGWVPLHYWWPWRTLPASCRGSLLPWAVVAV